MKAKKAEGCDTIKFLMSSDEGFAPGGSQVLMYSEEEAQAIGRAAREAGIWLACHAQAAEAVKRAVRAGFRSIFHCTYADEEALDLLEAHRDELFVAPAPGLLYARVHEAQAFGIGRSGSRTHGRRVGPGADGRRSIPKMRRRGIRVLPGGDYGFPYNPIGRNARDLQLFVELLGYTPTEALVAATRLGGELMDMPVGQVRRACWPTCCSIDGDPVADVRILQDKERMPVVMKDGRFHREPAGLGAGVTAMRLATLKDGSPDGRLVVRFAGWHALRACSGGHIAGGARGLGALGARSSPRCVHFPTPCRLTGWPRRCRVPGNGSTARPTRATAR